jgi:hypothetical protein
MAPRFVERTSLPTLVYFCYADLCRPEPAPEQPAWRSHMDIKKSQDLRPKCPYCENEISELVKVKRGGYEQHNVHCCPRCRKILGVGVGRH